jgi:quinol monooxygenase YgiN
VAIALVYGLSCAPERSEELRGALEALAAALSKIDGLRSVSVLRDVEQPDDFVFVEKWASVQAQERGGTSLPEQALARVMAALAAKPTRRLFEYVLEA